ncbi:MAG TPA: hypothetical protein EYH56_00945 [Nanoarchaeota archaeon]|nr:hypothetical protein [Nanoarchaeota archaeon]
MMMEHYEYYKIIEYEEFKKIIKERIETHKKLYNFYKELSENSNEATKKYAQEKMKEILELIAYDKFLLKEAELVKDEVIFLLDGTGAPGMIRTGKTLKKQIEEKIKENKKMYI